jgi:copper(I)-binding protein
LAQEHLMISAAALIEASHKRIGRVTTRMTIAAITALALCACQQAKQTDQTKHEPIAEVGKSAPAGKPGITIAGGRLVLPAVAGNPGAAYFQVDNSAGANIALAAIAINGAEKTEIHQTAGSTMTKVDSVEIAPSTSIKFEPGQLHVMVFNLGAGLKAGGTTEMTITFADGDKATATLKIEAAGGGGMGSMH